MNIYVSNIPFNANERDLQNVFEEFGEVSSVKIIKDKETGKSRGFGFVEMNNDDEGNQAVQGLNGSEFKGRELQVKQAYPREDSK